MDNLQHLAAMERLKRLESYRAGLRAAVRALWSGVWDEGQFYSEMERVIERGFLQAWVEGMEAVGLSEEDMTKEEQARLFGLMFEETNYIAGYASAIIEGSKENGGTLGAQYQRLELWVKRYTNVKNQAMQMAQNNPVLEWVLHANESCPSCLKMNGQRRRSSVWARLDIRPQHPRKLECMVSARGVDVCQCTLVPTDQPPSRGRLPRLP